MAFLEIMGLAIVVLLVIILIKLYKKEPKKEENEFANNLLLKQLQNIEKSMDSKAKEDSERQQKIMKCVEEDVAPFTRMMGGSSRRGKLGEAILKQILSEPISSGLVITDLDTDNGNVEFAWDLKNGKFLPIDSKLPELDKIYTEFEQAEKPEEQIKIKKEIISVVEKRKKEVKKYLNNKNTIDKCIVAIPDSIFDQFPDINKDSIKTGVFVSGYTKVFLFACVLGENYSRGLSLGNIGLYKQTVQALKNILGEIEQKSDTINKGITQITNANMGIKTEVDKSITKINQVNALESKNVKEIE